MQVTTTQATEAANAASSQQTGKPVQETPLQNDAPGRAGSATPRISISVDDTRKVRTLNVKAAVDNLSFYYGQHRALKNLTIPIADKQVTALIGPSGCGKSTFLRCFNRRSEEHTSELQSPI